MVICLERGADLHMVQQIPLPLTVSCFSKIQIGFTFLVPAHLGSPGERAVKRSLLTRRRPRYFYRNVAAPHSRSTTCEREETRSTRQGVYLVSVQWT